MIIPYHPALPIYLSHMNFICATICIIQKYIYSYCRWFCKIGTTLCLDGFRPSRRPSRIGNMQNICWIKRRRKLCKPMWSPSTLPLGTKNPQTTQLNEAGHRLMFLLGAEKFPKAISSGWQEALKIFRKMQWRRSKGFESFHCREISLVKCQCQSQNLPTNGSKLDNSPHKNQLVVFQVNTAGFSLLFCQRLLVRVLTLYGDSSGDWMKKEHKRNNTLVLDFKVIYVLETGMYWIDGQSEGPAL